MADPCGIEAIVQAAKDLPPAPIRHLIAIAGPPAAGKSTIAEEVSVALSAAGLAAAVVPVGRFHLGKATVGAGGGERESTRMNYRYGERNRMASFD